MEQWSLVELKSELNGWKNKQKLNLDCKGWYFLHCSDSINREPFDRYVVWLWLILAQLHKLSINLLIPAAQSSTNLWKFNQRPSLTHLSLTTGIINIINLFTLSIMLGTKTRRRYGDVQTLLKVLAQMWAGRLLPDDRHSSSEYYCFFCYYYYYYYYYYCSFCHYCLYQCYFDYY